MLQSALERFMDAMKVIYVGETVSGSLQKG